VEFSLSLDWIVEESFFFATSSKNYKRISLSASLQLGWAVTTNVAAVKDARITTPAGKPIFAPTGKSKFLSSGRHR